MLENEYTENRWNELLRVTRSWRLEWNVEHLLSRVSKEAVELLGLQRGIVYLLERKGIVGHAIFPPLSGFEAEKILPYSQQIAQQVIQSGRPIFAHELGEASKEGGDHGKTIRAVFCVPLTAGRGILGALYVDSGLAQKGLTQKDQEFLEMLGLQAAAALEHAILYQSAITDPLTGLYSHRHFQQEVEQSVRRALRTEQPVTLVLMDLDHFKALNDSCGHEVGNQCLTDVATLLRGSLRTTDVLARFGGDEFEVLLPGTSAESAMTVCEKIRRAIAELKLPRPITATLGIAAFPDNALDALSLFLRADEALYKAKEAGRNRIVRSIAKETSLPPPSQLRGNSPLGVSFPSPRALSPISKVPIIQSATESAITPAVALEAPVTEQIDGHTVLARLGTGSTGEVLLVRQPDLNRHVALKRPLTAHLTPEQADAFEREAKITAALEHPGVVTVHMMGRDLDGRRYYTMKPLHGLSLAHVLDGRRRGDLEMLRRFTFHRLLDIVQRVSETIAYAHERQVLHLDLSPSNIVVGQFGEVTIIDWGTGSENVTKKKGADETKDSGRLAFLVGSPAYLAPELLPGRHEQPAPSSDVFALGAILYEMLTGRPPFLKATTRETLDALMKGEVTPPELVVPEGGIDMVLSQLCMQSLNLHPGNRPSALQFSERLGQYVRKETVWEVTRFGKEHPLTEDDWVNAVGEWKIEGDEWVSKGYGDGLLLWKVPVAGAFRFVVDAWIEKHGELSLVGRGPTVDKSYAYRDTRQRYEGYCFQFGAEAQTCTKLARHAIDVQAEGGLAPEAGRHYRLELEYDDGWVRCFIDGKRIFGYRELFASPGQHIGFYAYGSGAHFRPLEVHRETWGLQVPVISIADELFRMRSYETALPRYEEFARHHSGRVEGAEARLKMGLCLKETGRFKEAREVLASLAGGPFEPFAIAETAAMELHPNSQTPQRGLQMFKELLQRFPESSARFRINEVAQDNRRMGYHWNCETLAADAQICKELEQLGLRTSSRPAQTQMIHYRRLIRILMQLGQWREALQESREFTSRLQPAQLRAPQYQSPYIVAHVVNGLFEGLPTVSDLGQLQTFEAEFRMGFVPHVLVQRNEVQAFLDKFQPKVNSPEFKDTSLSYLVLFALLTQGRREEARQLIENNIMLNMGTNVFIHLRGSIAASDAQMESTLEKVIAAIPPGSHPGEERDFERVRGIVRARNALDFGNLSKAAAVLECTTIMAPHFQIEEGFLLQLLLSTLGLIKSPTREELANRCATLLTGTAYDLSQMFLEKKEPRPNELWPHPLWRPEWRLWLALWLEARGDIQGAREVALPAVDKRFGLTNSQPALEALMERTRTAVNA